MQTIEELKNDEKEYISAIKKALEPLMELEELGASSGLANQFAISIHAMYEDACKYINGEYDN